MNDFAINEYKKRIPIDNKIDIDKFLRYGGYYDVNNNWNSIVEVEGYPGKIFRGRVEVFLFKDNKVYIDLSSGNKYRIPGGSFDINKSHKRQVFDEIKEETKIISKNILYTGLSYVTQFVKLNKITRYRMSWDGTYNEVYVAEYDKLYNGFIKTSVYDKNMHMNGGFYSLYDIAAILKPEHICALRMLKIL